MVPKGFVSLSIDCVRPLLSLSIQQQLSPSSSFEMTYDLNLNTVCADFKENIDFRFSLGWTALVTRFIGATNARRALSSERRPKVSNYSVQTFSCIQIS